MGYTTEFNGSFKITPALPPKQVKYLQKFNKTRRMNRDTEKVKTLPDQERVAVDLPIGDGSGYFVGGIGFMGQNNDDSIINYNRPARGQPSLWCQWTVNDEGTELAWDEDEKFYCYVEWLDYIITHFLKIWGVELNGIIEWKGEGSEDFGRIVVDSNNVRTQTTEISLQRLTKTPAGAIRRGGSMDSLKTTIMRRDGLTSVQADAKIKNARDAITEYLEYGDTESAHEVCEEFFGLEPDYLLDLI